MMSTSLRSLLGIDETQGVADPVLSDFLGAASEAQSAGSDIDRLMAAIRGQEFERADPEPVKPLKKMLMGLASALSARGAARGGGRAVDFLGAERARRAAEADRANRLGMQEFGIDRSNMLLELQDLIGQRNVAQAEGRQIAGEERAAGRRRTEDDAQREFRAGEAEKDRTFRERMEGITADLRRELAGARAGAEDARQRASKLEAKQGVLGIRDQIVDGSLDMTPAEVRQRFEEMLDITDLSDAGRAEVIEFYLAKIEPIFEERERVEQELAAEETGREQIERLEQQRIQRERRAREARLPDLAKKALDRGGFFGSSKF